MTSTDDSVPSPCIGVCTMNEAIGLCAGCYRTMEEIREWWNMPNDRCQEVIAAAQERQAQYLAFD